MCRRVCNSDHMQQAHHQEYHDCSHLSSFGFLHTRGMSGSDETSRGVGTRAPRPATIKFNPSVLTKKWDSLGQRRNPGFDWDGSSYTSCGWSLSPDVSSLCSHKEGLALLIEVAATGFPSHPCLKTSLQQLHQKYNIFGQTARLEKLSCDSTDRWRIMCRRLYDLAKSGTAAPGLESLITQIILPTTESRAESRAEVRAKIPEEGAGDEAGGVGPPQHLSAQDVQDLFPNMENMDGEHTDASDELMTEARHEVRTQVMTAMEVDVDEELDIMAFTCRCPECCPKDPLQEVGSVQTAAGTDPILIPNPKQGGQRTDSLKKRRIFKKTTPSHVSERKKGKGVKNGLKKKTMSAEALTHPIALPVTLC